MKKIFLTIAFFVISNLSSGQSNDRPGNVNQDLRQYNNPEMAVRARKVGEIGLGCSICGAVIAGGGYGYILLSAHPNAPFGVTFSSGVTFCVLGGILCIYGIVQLVRSAVFLSRGQKITLTPSDHNIGIALNF